MFFFHIIVNPKVGVFFVFFRQYFEIALDYLKTKRNILRPKLLNKIWMMNMWNIWERNNEKKEMIQDLGNWDPNFKKVSPFISCKYVFSCFRGRSKAMYSNYEKGGSDLIQRKLSSFWEWKWLPSTMEPFKQNPDGHLSRMQKVGHLFDCWQSSIKLLSSNLVQQPYASHIV